MTLSIIFEFMKSFYKEIITGSLIATIWFLHVDNNMLEVQLSLAEQKATQVEERLKVSNASITQLEASISTQNEQLQKLNTLQQGKVNDSKLKLLEAKKNNEELQKEIDNLTSQQGSDNMCKDIEILLNGIGK